MRPVRLASSGMARYAPSAAGRKALGESGAMIPALPPPPGLNCALLCASPWSGVAPMEPGTTGVPPGVRGALAVETSPPPAPLTKFRTPPPALPSTLPPPPPPPMVPLPTLPPRPPGPLRFGPVPFAASGLRLPLPGLIERPPALTLGAVPCAVVPAMLPLPPPTLTLAVGVFTATPPPWIVPPPAVLGATLTLPPPAGRPAVGVPTLGVLGVLGTLG